MQSTDRNNHPGDAYPVTYLDGVYLGINGGGVAEYMREDFVFLAEYSDEGLQVPPEDFEAVREPRLEGRPLHTYLRLRADELGPWAYLTEVSEQALRNANRDPGEVLAAGEP